MPIPTPKAGQTKDEFISACMADNVMQEYKQDQRYAICNQQWNRKTTNHVTNGLSGYSVREAELEGRMHWIVPCTLLVEGVHNGSGGAIYYSPEVISQHDSEWNGKPVTIIHPSDVQGQPTLCAASPDVYNRHVVGKVFNAHVHNGQLKAELWLDQMRLRELDPALAERIQQRAPVEVSTGLVPLALTESGGTWKNEEYDTAVTAFRPDHLALLPSQCGACSLADGCGIHNKEVKNVMENARLTPDEMKKMETMSPEEKKKFMAMTPEERKKMMANEDTPVANSCSCGCSNFKSKADGEPPVADNGGEKVEEKKVDEKVTTNAEPKVETPPPAPALVVKTPEEIFNMLPTEVRESINNGMAMYNRAKAGLVQTILKAVGNAFTEVELNSKNVPELEKISALLPKPVQEQSALYFGNAGGVPVDNSGPKIEPLAVPTLADFAPAK
jgi:hypothetical protein